jgi:hypothetical protein
VAAASAWRRRHGGGVMAAAAWWRWRWRRLGCGAGLAWWWWQRQLLGSSSAEAKYEKNKKIQSFKSYKMISIGKLLWNMRNHSKICANGHFFLKSGTSKLKETIKIQYYTLSI